MFSGMHILARAAEMVQAEPKFEPRVVQIVPKRKTGVVIDPGHAPFARAPDGAVIPNAFQIAVRVGGTEWIGRTNVSENGEAVTYNFTKKGAAAADRVWFKTPTEAFNHAYELEKSTPPEKGMNGKLFIGVTYPAVQEILAEIHPEAFNLGASKRVKATGGWMQSIEFI